MAKNAEEPFKSGNSGKIKTIVFETETLKKCLEIRPSPSCQSCLGF